MNKYNSRIKSRSFFHFLKGSIPRFFNHYRSNLICAIGRINGANIGVNSYLTLSLAFKANENLVIGDSSIIETNSIDLRDKVIIGDNVIINKGVEIIRASHSVDSKDFETISYPLIVENYVWIATKALVLPKCSLLSYGTVVGAGSVVVASVRQKKSIVAGNPAIFKRVRRNVYDKLVVESLQGRDFHRYFHARYNY